MSQIKPSLAVISLALSLCLSGCGDRNSEVVFSPESGHPAGWSTGHKTAARSNSDSCFECHGEDLTGGIANVSCTQCHLGSKEAVHPLLWGQYAYARHNSYVAANGASSCANAACHGPALAGVAGSGPSCATACHLGGASSKHPAVWTQYSSHANYVKNKGYDSSGCSTRTCHGTDAKGVFLSGPSCFSCHPADPTIAAPVPDKHPHNLVINNFFNHKQYVLTYGASSCVTNICHGTGGPGPSCSTSGCH